MLTSTSRQEREQACVSQSSTVCRNHVAENYIKKKKMARLSVHGCESAVTRSCWGHTVGVSMIKAVGLCLHCSVSVLVTEWESSASTTAGAEQEAPGMEVIIHACGADSFPDRSVLWMVCKYSRTNMQWDNKSGTGMSYHSVPGPRVRWTVTRLECTCVNDSEMPGVSTCSSTLLRMNAHTRLGTTDSRYQTEQLWEKRFQNKSIERLKRILRDTQEQTSRCWWSS